MRSLFTLLILALTIGSCRQPDAITPDTLTGTWIEKTARRDTLIFNPDFQGKTLINTLTVSRGKELNLGVYLLPKIRSGIYKYEIRGKRIYVQNSLSSRAVGEEYAIEQTGDRLRVENFFELGFNQPATATRMLVRLK